MTRAAARSAIDLFCAFEGRIGRRSFWMGSIAVALALVAAGRAAAGLAPAHKEEIDAFAGLFAFYPWSALAAQRARDRRRPWAWGPALVALVLLPNLLAGALPVVLDPQMRLLGLAAWLVALVDLGLLPGRPAERDAAVEPARERAAA